MICKGTLFDRWAIGFQTKRILALPDLTEADIIHALNGLPIAAVAHTLAGMGARDISLFDVAESGLAHGTPLGPGLLAGEAKIVIVFGGVPRGFLWPAKRWRIVVSHSNGRVMDVLQIGSFAK
jgi:hypothetical protein